MIVITEAGQCNSYKWRPVSVIVIGFRNGFRHPKSNTG